MTSLVAPRIESDLDPFSPEFRAEPYRHYAELRALGPVVWLAKHGIWAVSHHAQIRAVLGNWQDFSNAGGGGLTNFFTEKNWRSPSIVLEVDPPLHTRTRAVLSRVLSKGAVDALRPSFEAVAHRLIDAALARGRIDAVSELAQPFPLTVFADAVGMPPLDRRKMLVYGAMVFGGFGPRTAWYEQIMEQAEGIGAWIDARCEREALSATGLGAAVYAAADEGAISPAEAKLLVRSLLSAGVDTTIDSIALALRCLAEHPEQWAALRTDPSLARGAFEEATRYDGSSQGLFRTTARAFEFEGAALARHDKVLVLIGSAGRDPAQWQHPDRFDIRRRISQQLSYGTGIHGCVAQTLARLEGEVFFRAIAERVQLIEPAGPSSLRQAPGLRGLDTLPLILTARPAKARPAKARPAKPGNNFSA